ncbi:MAG: diaminobutyrate acetyltransferase [Myxococcales bacterium]|nr:diaminobutyrate acetyltransferase [Myxococcales bacterium]
MISAARAWDLRQPKTRDASAVRELVEATGTLEPNTCYAYLLLCTHFAETCLLAEREGKLVGFVLAYRPPSHPEAVFVWQIGVHQDARGQGLARQLLEDLLRQPGTRGVRFVEATVGSSNEASRRLFESFARALGVPCEVQPGFVSADFGPLAHEDEALYRIGPLVSGAVGYASGRQA